MARSSKTQITGVAADFSKLAKEVVDVRLEEEVEKAFLSYAYLSIENRSIPDARDGMKPVQRRILYTMYRDGNTPEKQHVKSAKIVGSCMGTLHPHGDSAIYDAMVRLAQPFALNTPVVDGRGNFGDRPGAGAASARYTEARMSKAALLMTDELRERPVPFGANYDQTTDEPTVLPNQFPFLTVNGVSGIAVGFATNMAPHNLEEVVNATRWLVTHPNADLDKLMSFVPGPDFPTGCEIVGLDGIREGYETGRGKILIRAPYTIENTGRGKSAIVFYELPYEQNSENIIDQLKAAITKKQIIGIADVKDLTDRRNGIRLVIDVKAGVNAKVLVASLYKHTALETAFTFNNIALVNGRPKLLGLKEQLDIFIAHRMEVVTNRTQKRADKRKDRLHLIDALLKALHKDIIDETIAIIRGSSDATAAQTGLMKKFKIDEGQADYILAIPLRRLTKYDQLELTTEKKKLEAELKELLAILKDESVLRSVIVKELDEVKKAIPSPRRSAIVGGTVAEAQAAVKEMVTNGSAEIADEECYVVLTNKGAISRVTKAPTGAFSAAKATTRGKFIAVTNKGRAFRLETITVGTRAGVVSGVLPEKLPKGETVIAVTPTDLAEGQTGGIAMGTRKGVVKIAAPQWPMRSDDFSIMNLDADDEILSARWVDDVKAADLVFVSSDSSLLTFSADKVRPQGLSGAGMAGMKLAPEQTVIVFSVVLADEKAKTMVTTYTGQTIKTSAFSEFPAKGRATGGVRSHKFLRGESSLRLASVSVGGLLYASDGKEVPLPKPSKRDASGTKFEDETIF
jgi:DNA gyrase subunit A